MSERPLVTIGIPSYNSAAHIREALDSALAQTYEPLEILVVDDASTDATHQIAAAYDDPRLSVCVNDTNLGLAGNHNRVIEMARGEYVKVLHADDILAPGAIEAQAKALSENPEVALVTCKRAIIDEEGRRIVNRGAPWPEGVRDGRDVVREVVRSGRNLLGEPSAQLFRREAALEAGRFSADWPYAVDLEFCVRLLLHGDVFYSPETLASFRVTTGQESARLSSIQAADGERLFETIRREYDLGLTEADVARGTRVARRDAFMRRMLYSVLALPADSRERIAYVIGGIWNTAFAYVVFALLWMVLGSIWPYWVILAATSLLGALNAFVVQRQLVFRSRGNILAEFGRFSLVYVVIGVLNIAVFPLLKDALKLDPYVAQALFTVFVIVAGYVANKYFSFRAASGNHG